MNNHPNVIPLWQRVQASQIQNRVPRRNGVRPQNPPPKGAA